MINRLIIFAVMASAMPRLAAADDAVQQQIVAEVIAAEACGEGVRGMALVAEVIRNRSRAWKKTPYQIVTQKHQFEAYTSKNRKKLFLQCKTSALAIKGRLYADSLKNEAKGALYFQTLKMPRRKWHKIKVLTYLNHVFYK